MRPRSTPCWPPWIAGTVWMPRSRRWPPRSLHPGSDPAGVPARGLDVDRVRAGHRDRGLGPPVRPVHRRLPWAGAHRVLLGLHPLPGRGHQRRQQPCPPTADRSRVASPNPVSAGARAAPTMGRDVARARARRQAANRRLHTRWVGFDERKKRSVVANAPSPENSPAGAGHWPSSTTNTHTTVRMTSTRRSRQASGSCW